jgi:hypothetical protein
VNRSKSLTGVRRRGEIHHPIQPFMQQQSTSGKPRENRAGLLRRWQLTPTIQTYYRTRPLWQAVISRDNFGQLSTFSTGLCTPRLSGKLPVVDDGYPHDSQDNYLNNQLKKVFLVIG